MTRRVPKRSSSQPRTGQATAVQMAARNTALDRSPRVMPSSAETGLRKTPEEKIRTGPEPTSSPKTDAATTSQRLANSPPMTPSLSGTFAGDYLLLLDPNDRHYIRGRRGPALMRLALRDQAQLAREDPPPENDRRVRAAEKFAGAVFDRPLAGLHR